jgi:hypothetical protein
MPAEPRRFDFAELRSATLNANGFMSLNANGFMRLDTKVR